MRRAKFKVKVDKVWKYFNFSAYEGDWYLKDIYCTTLTNIFKSKTKYPSVLHLVKKLQTSISQISPSNLVKYLLQ